MKPPSREPLGCVECCCEIVLVVLELVITGMDCTIVDFIVEVEVVDVDEVETDVGIVATGTIALGAAAGAFGTLQKSMTTVCSTGSQETFSSWEVYV
jgi:hypothetical protein